MHSFSWPARIVTGSGHRLQAALDYFKSMAEQDFPEEGEEEEEEGLELETESVSLNIAAQTWCWYEATPHCMQVPCA